jgi:phosphatidylglycerophosphate synthase
VTKGYTYRASVKSDISDELVNTYVMRPTAGVLVRALYPTKVTPNQVTVAAAIAGFAASALYCTGDPLRTAVAGLCLTAKDILDSADGQLARAKGMFSRAGRFLDSIVDIAVNLCVCAANAAAAVAAGAGAWAVAAWCAAFLGMTLRVSYHVFYQSSYLHLHDAYEGNRTSEAVRPEDAAAGGAAFALQRVFQFLYGWQDAWMASIDRWCRGGVERSGLTDTLWYGDARALRLSGFLGLGTELFLLMLCSVAGAMTVYLWVNLLLMNALWGSCVWYRRVVLRAALSGRGRLS